MSQVSRLIETPAQNSTSSETTDILLELFKNPVFYKLIIFESLDTELFIKFMKYHEYTSNAIYTKFDNDELIFEEGKNSKYIFDKTVKNTPYHLEKYNTHHSKIPDNNDKIFYILDIEKFYKTMPKFKIFIDTDKDFKVVISNFLKDIIDIKNKHEIELDNTIQNLKIDNNKDILTFLKLRNDENTDQVYNERFKIFLNKNKNPNKLLLYYNINNNKYYEKNGDQIISTNVDRTFEDESYKYKYLFGPFTQIFNPSISNEDIAKKMGAIKKSLTDGNDVFMIGYGASGAGKTSTLVYLDAVIDDEPIKENGIVVNICNQISDEFNKIELSFNVE